MTRSSILTALATLGVFLSMTINQAAFGVDYPPRYHVTVLEAFEGGITTAYALNDHGQVTGESGDPSGSGYHAFIWQRGSEMIAIDGPGWDSSGGVAINNSGQVAGTAKGDAFGGETSAFRYTPGVGMEPLDFVDGNTFEVVDMNESGEILGRYYFDHTSRGCVNTEAGGTVDVGLVGTGPVYVRDINDAGQVVGYGYPGGVGRRFLLWEDGNLQTLGTLGGNSSEAYYINASGLTVGVSSNSESVQVPFTHTESLGMQPVPLPVGAVRGMASWVTDTGIVIGEWFGEGDSHRGFVYTEADGVVDMGLEFGSIWWTGPVAANSRAEVVILTHEEETYELFPLYFAPGVGGFNLMDQLNVELDDWRSVEPMDINEAGQILLIGTDMEPLSRRASALLTPIERGDMNCDGEIDGLDVMPFVQALIDPAAYAVDHPRCADYFADLSDDGQVGPLDVEPFVALLLAEQ